MAFTQAQADALIASFGKKDSQNTDYWEDVTANAPGDAKQAFMDYIAPFLSPIETAKTLGDLGTGIYSLMTDGDAPEEALAVAIGDYYSERYGSLDAVKNSFRTNPVTTSMDLLSVVNPAAAVAKAGAKGARKAASSNIGAKVAEKVGADVAREFVEKTLASPARQAVSQIEAITPSPVQTAARATGSVASSLGRAANVLADPAPAVVQGAGTLVRGVGDLAANALGQLSGTGSDNVTRAFNVGRSTLPGSDRARQFMSTMTGAPDAVTDVEFVDAATQGAKRLREQASDQYSKTFAGIDMSAQDPNRFTNALNAVEENKKRYIQPKAGAPLKVDPKSQTKKAFEQINAAVNEYASGSDQSLEALLNLRQRIDNVEIDTSSDNFKKARAIRNDVRDAITRDLNEIPGFSQMNADYTQATKLADEIADELNLNNYSNVSQKLRKLQSVTRNNVNTNFGRRVDLLSEINTDQPFDLIEVATAKALNPTQATGIQRLGQSAATLGALGGILEPAAAVASTALSPRNVGRGAFAAGRASAIPMGILSAASPAIPNVVRGSVAAERAGILGADPEELEAQRRLSDLLDQL
tara:strand:+ start:3565 stop:5319 length:1755 start_codon:yes stop_codon:yes gene_type:complete